MKQPKNLQQQLDKADDNVQRSRSLIVGGKVARDGDFPAFAWSGIGSGGWGCGGTRIHKDIVMSGTYESSSAVDSSFVCSDEVEFF